MAPCILETLSVCTEGSRRVRHHFGSNATGLRIVMLVGRLNPG